MSLVLKLTLALCLLVPAVGITKNFSFKMCDVPVCSIRDTLFSLRGMNADQRGMYAINLASKYKDSTDVKALENLREAGIEMKSLFTELGDDDWVRRAAADLINAAVLGLGKFSDVDGENLGGLYRELMGQSSRYHLISFWQGKLTSIEETELLEQLIIFAALARVHSASVGDEDWVPRAAKSLISDATVKLTHLDPAHEGLYDVAVHGAPNDLRGLSFDRVVVMDSSSSKNLVVSLINSRLRAIVHTFTHAELIGHTITGLLLTTEEMATKLTMTLDRRASTVEGTVESTKYGFISFSGQQLVSSSSVFAGPPSEPLSDKDVLGTMKGELGGVKGKLTIRSFKEQIYSATFISDSGSILLHFQGKFFPKRGALSFTSGEKIKLMISLRNKNWSGFSLSTTTGTYSEARFSVIRVTATAPNESSATSFIQQLHSLTGPSGFVSDISVFPRTP